MVNKNRAYSIDSVVVFVGASIESIDQSNHKSGSKRHFFDRKSNNIVLLQPVILGISHCMLVCVGL